MVFRPRPTGRKGTGISSIRCASRRQRHKGKGERAGVPCGTLALFLLSERARWWRGSNCCCGKAKFSFACQKRTRKAPAISTRWIHEKGAARPFQTPKELSKHKNASRFAKRIFCTSLVYGSADGVTFSQNFTFCKGVKSAAKQQMGETRKKR